MKESRIKGYLCSEDGKVYSVKVKGGQGRLDYNNPVEMTYKIDRYGYKTVCLSYLDEDGNHIRKYPTVHRLVYETFHGKIEEGMEVDHINNDKLDNSLANLQLLTRYENGVKRSKDWAYERQNVYKVYDYNTNHEEILKTTDIMNKYGISNITIFKMGISGARSSKQLKTRGIDIRIEKV